MIYTVTLNPAIDYNINIDKINPGSVNRAGSDEIFIGGKGINVSIVLKELGIDSVTFGFVAGFTGNKIEKELQEKGIETDFVHLESGFSRINVKIKSDVETEINGTGPDIPPEKLDEFFKKLNILQDGDIIILAGSVPKSLPDNIYEIILEKLQGKNIKAVCDAGGELLLNVLKYRPFLIKPNNQELGEIFKTEINDFEKAQIYAEELRKMGAVNVIVSMAGDGSVLIDESGERHIIGTAKGELVNSVGAGDSMIAGFLAGISRGYDYALKLGTASGGATAFSKGLADREKIFELLKSI